MDINMVIKCLGEIKKNNGNVKVLLQNRCDIKNINLDKNKNVLIIK